MVRTGIATYGISPDPKRLGSSERFGLRPAMTLRARLLLVKEIPAGTSVGYGLTATTSQTTFVGVVPLGYADGIPRNTSSAAWVLAGNQHAHLLGRVSMDQFVVDLGQNSKSLAGDWVTLFGSGSLGEPTVQDWADANNTIHYEIVTRLGSRVTRVYSEAENS